jgi:hypothetical protein
MHVNTSAGILPKRWRFEKLAMNFGPSAALKITCSGTTSLAGKSRGKACGAKDF